MQSINCQQCKKDFKLTEKDQEFLEMLKVPAPTFCPECRLIRRFAFRNERALYKRKCDLCQKESIMMYPADAPFPVYCKPCWWSDKWSATDFGRDYDFGKPFFQQFKELFSVVPQPAVIHQGNIVNSDYTNRVTDVRNCYLVFGTSTAEYCRYSTWVMGSKETQDSYTTLKSERCYECIDCINCYNIAFSRESTNCRDSWFLFNCTNVSDSFGCVNLRNKQYCIYNEQYTKEEYEQKLAQMNVKSYASILELKEKFEIFRHAFIVPAMTTRRSIDSTGNYIDDCKEVTNSYNCQNGENIRHCFSTFVAKDSMDYSYWGASSQRVYEAINCGMQLSNVHFADNSWIQLIDSEYVMNCHNAKNVFGSVGVRAGQYVILNKQYAKEEYELMVEKIKKQMDEMPYFDGGGRVYKYGEFFPIELSPHAYNECLSQEFYPISKEEAQVQKFPWREAEPRNYKITMPASQIPDTMEGVGDEILQQIIGCEHAASEAGKPACNDQCTTAFRLIPEELAMHKSTGIPLPKHCPNCRHYARIQVRNPFKLWPRACQCAGDSAEGGEYQNTSTHDHGTDHCERSFETSYSPERSEKVYCIECYQQEVS